MIFEIEISDQADNDLRDIYEYIVFELQSSENASGQLDRLEESILGLDQMPELFPISLVPHSDKWNKFYDEMEA